MLFISLPTFLLSVYFFWQKNPSGIPSSVKQFESRSGLKIIKLFSCSTQQSMNYIMLTNIKMPTIVGILTFISIINTSQSSISRKTLFFSILVFIRSTNFMPS